MKDRLTEADMLNLADQIMDLPLHIEIDIGSEKYLLAHAMTFAPLYREQEETMYLEGIAEMQKYWQYGIKGYVSLIGHHDSGYQYNNLYGSYLDDKLNSIWVNEPEMYTWWIVDVVFQMEGLLVFVWKPERDFIHELCLWD